MDPRQLSYWANIAQIVGTLISVAVAVHVVCSRAADFLEPRISRLLFKKTPAADIGPFLLQKKAAELTDSKLPWVSGSYGRSVPVRAGFDLDLVALYLKKI